MKIKTVLMLVELDDGTIHQVIARKEIKDLCISLLSAETGKLLISEINEPITLETLHHD